MLGSQCQSVSYAGDNGCECWMSVGYCQGHDMMALECRHNTQEKRQEREKQSQLQEAPPALESPRAPGRQVPAVCWKGGMYLPGRRVCTSSLFVILQWIIIGDCQLLSKYSSES